jgi:hypothetical protein
MERGLAWGRFHFRFDYDYDPVMRPFEASVGGRRLAARIQRDFDHISGSLAGIASHAGVMSRIPVEADSADPAQPHWDNSWLPGLDAATLYTLVAERRPAHYLEVGSGNSTKFVRRAIRDHGLATRILSIDPEPRAEVDQLCDEVIRSRVEQVDIEAITRRLAPGDVVFVDNSHRGFQGSDVTVCLMELMPALPPGTLFGVHDICLPYDYDPCFRDYFYNEQYYLGMYLLGGAAGDRVVMPAYHACRASGFRDLVFDVLGRAGVPEAARGGTSFWLELGLGGG